MVVTVVSSLCSGRIRPGIRSTPGSRNPPSYVLPFIDRLAPGLERAADEMTDPNAQRVVRQTRELLLQNVKAAESFAPMDAPQISETLLKIIKEDMSMYDSPQLASMVDYAGQEAWHLVDAKNFELADWTSSLEAHINLVTEGPVNAQFAGKIVSDLILAKHYGLLDGRWRSGQSR